MRVGGRNQHMMQRNQSVQQQRQVRAGEGEQNGVAVKQRDDTPLMAITRRIKSEQGEKQAGYFLHSVKPYIAPGEIVYTEQLLGVKATQNPNSVKQNTGGMPEMLKLIMSLMNGGKADPMQMLKMMKK